MLADVLAHHLKLVICGTAVGNASAQTNSYYADPRNQFWQTLAAVGLTSRQLMPSEFRDLLHDGIGLTDLAKGVVGPDVEVAKEAYDIDSFTRKIQQYAPAWVAFNGKTAAKLYFGNRDVDYGAQAEALGNTGFYILPSTSGSARGAWEIKYWQALAELIK